MCGRFALNVTPADVEKLFGYEERPNFPPRDNIAPTEPIAVVTFENGERHFRLMRWGLLPGWLKEPDEFPVLFNARGETITTKPAFRAAARHRRCLVPASGFYEWKQMGTKKVPHRLSRHNAPLFAMAGLWEPYAHVNGSEIDTATIVTTNASCVVADLHVRMPVIIPEDKFSIWLETETYSLDEAMALVRPAPDTYFKAEAFDPRRGPLSDVKPEGPKRRTAKPKPEDNQGSLF
jgi:putative SOS response-associated peptidase YedK